MESCSPSPRATVIASSSAIFDFLRAKAHMVATRGPSAPPEQRIHTWCPPFALKTEALAAVEACFFAIEHQFRQVQFEMNCREVIRGVQGNILRGQWELYPFLCKIKEHLGHPNFVDLGLVSKNS
ncbi:hypothetical protein GBA52_024664 [Prunus armeniaca]|nr:hypothetical protein GBA52_024664 [Prunus armeniaca]